MAAAIVLGAAAPGASSPKGFTEVLGEVRKANEAHRKVARASADDRSKPGELVETLKADVRIEIDLRDACERSGRHLTKGGSLYFEVKALRDLGWTFEDPPDEKKADPVATRARHPELVAKRTPSGASAPDVQVTIDAFNHKCLTATDKREKETYPFPGAGLEVACSDVQALLQAHVDEWKSGCAETSSPVRAAKKQIGIADWSASLVGKVKDTEITVRREWYAWTGESFRFIYDGATFVATVTYSDAAVTDPKTVQQVHQLLKALNPVVK